MPARPSSGRPRPAPRRAPDLAPVTGRSARRGAARAAVAQALRAFREEADISQEHLGERAGLHRTYVGGYERGERRLTVDAVGQVLAALGRTWAEFGTAVDTHVRLPSSPHATRLNSRARTRDVSAGG